LAEELPSTGKGTWVVRPDGTMQTTYRLRPNVTWHDGTPLTAEDLAFGWAVTSDPALPVESKAASSEIARIEAPDDHTLLIEWQRLYVQAYAITEDDLGPFASHLLRPLYEADKQQMWGSPYWTTMFVGVGPFKLMEWQPGEHILLHAYDGFFGGRPRVDQIVIRFIPSQDTIVANLLARTVDFDTGKGRTTLQQKIEIRNAWQQAGLQPTVLTSTGNLQILWVQYGHPVVPELTDARVRRALLLALDRQTMADTLTDGLAPVADTFLPPDDLRWDWVKDGIARYPYDSRQADALFAESGLRRGPDGVLVNAAGARMDLPHWTVPGTSHEQQLAIEADNWRGAGVLTQQKIQSPSEANDVRTIAGFSGLYQTVWPTPTLASIEARFLPSKCPSEQNNWTGQNYGCYLNPAWEQVMGQLKAALDPSDQRAPYLAAARLHTEDLPFFTLYFDVNLEVLRPGITGVKGVAKPDGDLTWNLPQWDIE
ncbi:MAG TPA: ABC transporter substrate-binding protein, partial [Chloroflexota bacterium]